MGLQFVTLKCIARVLSQKFFEKTSYNFMGNVGLYSVGIGMTKSTLKKFSQ